MTMMTTITIYFPNQLASPLGKKMLVGRLSSFPFEMVPFLGMTFATFRFWQQLSTVQTYSLLMDDDIKKFGYNVGPYQLYMEL